MPRAVCSTILCFAFAACSRDVAAPPDLAVRWLADEAAVGQPTRREQFGGVSRVALAGTHLAVLAPPPVLRAPVGDDGSRDASVICPSPLAGRDGVLTVGSRTAAEAGVPTLVQRIRCAASAGTAVDVRMPPYPGLDQAIWIIRGLEVDRTETAPLSLAAGARLRASLGISGTVPGEPAAPARFRVEAVDAAGWRATVLDRRLDPATDPAAADWVQVDLDLDPVRRALGPEVRLIFDARVEADASSMAFPVWGDPAVVWPRSAAAPGPPRRNVVLISLDTLRPDRLGLYGHERPTSPTLDALAAESTVFETVIAPAPWTFPSHTSMLTGLHECVHGMAGTVGHPFPPGLRPLASRLRDAGYATAAVTEDGFVDATAFMRGFGYYWENRDGDDRVRRTVAQAETWLRDEATEPFFLFVHTYQTHEPYFAPAPYDTLFAVAEEGGGAIPAAQAAADQRQLTKYDRAVRYTDASIAPLLDALRARPRGERTLLVVTSDHGEAFREHGYTGHGRTLHEEVLRVPLLVRAPGLVAAGRRVPGLVGVIDITPTILDLLGLPVPAGITGVSLAPQLRRGTTPPPPPPERLLYSENTLHNVYRLAIRAPRWKAMYEDDSVQLLDLERDPTEQVASPTPALAADAAAARARFEEECRRQKAELDAAGAATVAEPVGLPDAGRQRQLKALGYVE